MNLKYRPFAAIGFTTLLSLFLIIYFGELFAPVFIGVGALLAVVSLLIRSVREKIVPILIAVSLIFSGLMYYTAQTKIDNVYKYYDKTAHISGKILVKECTNDRYYYTLDLNEIDGESVDSKLRLSVPEEISADYFDCISLEAHIYDISPENKGIRLYYYSDGVYLAAYSLGSVNPQINVKTGISSSFERFVFDTREMIKTRVADNIGGEKGATVTAMLLGDKSGLSDERVESFREVGIAPIFAVSGLHLSVWVLGLFAILRSLGVRKRLNSVIAIIFAVFFMFLAGLTPSVCRAGVMMIVLLFGNLFYRKADSANSLGFVAFIMCAINPFIAVDIGFILSFSATLGIITLVPVCEKHIFEKLPDNLFSSVLHKLLLPVVVSLSASIAVLPATIIMIGYVSVLSVISNVVLNYIAMLCMIMGGLGAALADIPFVSDVVFSTSELLAEVLLRIVDFMCSWSLTTVSTENIFWKVGAIASVAIVIVCVFNFKGKNIFKAACIGLAANIIIFSLSSYFYYYNLTQVRILNVSDGISVVAYSGGRKIVITGKADSYDKIYAISDTLDYYGMNDPELFLIPDIKALEDNSNFLLMKEYNFNRIVLPYSNKSLESVVSKDRIFDEPRAVVEIFDNDRIQYMCCEDFSLAHCTFNDVEILLLFSSTVKSEIPDEYISADYLVCCGYIPYCINPTSYSEIIVCGPQKRSESIVKYVSERGANALPMNDSDAVVFNIREDSHKYFVLED